VRRHPFIDAEEVLAVAAAEEESEAFRAGALYPASGNSVALGSVAPQPVGRAGGEVPGVDFDFPVDDVEGFLQVGDLLLHLRLMSPQDLQPLGLVAGAIKHQLRIRRISGSGIPDERSFMHTLSHSTSSSVNTRRPAALRRTGAKNNPSCS
jgi:hypothetical protein